MCLRNRFWIYTSENKPKAENQYKFTFLPMPEEHLLQLSCPGHKSGEYCNRIAYMFSCSDLIARDKKFQGPRTLIMETF